MSFRSSLVSTILGGAGFGAAVGSYVGGWQIAFAAVKMPVFLLGTLALCLAIFAVLASSTIGTRASMEIAFRTIGSTAMVLGGLAPPLLLLGLGLPKPAPKGYSGMIVALTVAVAVAGVVGVSRLRRALSSGRLWISWIVIYGFVGAQMAWLLKPWVGYTLTADRFLPLAENLNGNFYEAAWGSLMRVLR